MLLHVGVLVACFHVTAATVTVPTTVVPTSASMAHAHTAHVVIPLHRSAAVAILTRENNTAKADKDEGDDSDHFLSQRSCPPNEDSENGIFLRLKQMQVNVCSKTMT